MMRGSSGHEAETQRNAEVVHGIFFGRRIAIGCREECVLKVPVHRIQLIPVPIGEHVIAKIQSQRCPRSNSETKPAANLKLRVRE